MKIRTITTGISLESLENPEAIAFAADFNRQAQDWFSSQGYEVQTTRISTNPWSEYLSPTNIIDSLQKLSELCHRLKLNFFNIGYAKNPAEIALIPAILQNTSRIFCSSQLNDGKNSLSFANIQATAEVIKAIANTTNNGDGNFRFCAWANCPPGIPFFPVSYHEGSPAFASALEWSDLLAEVFSYSTHLEAAEQHLFSILSEKFLKVEKISQEIAEKFAIKYRGIDASLAPSLDQTFSIAFAYESLGLIQKFGQPGTLAISETITKVLKKLPVQLCGYSGLMLPVCEDAGLAQRATENAYNLTNLLAYSAVCGCGLDTVPLPGNIRTTTLAAILTDLATLALKLNKPLSARLFPIPGKEMGEMATFLSPYLVGCKIFDVE